MGTKGMKFLDRQGGSPKQRFEKNYIPEPNSGCWIWLGNLSGSKGYGYIFVDGKSMRAHRFSYELINGPIPDGLVIDHLCKMPWCVNPEHLEAVTQKENMRRGANTGRYNKFCKRGHPRFGENLYVFPTGQKACRECRFANTKEERLRKN